MDSVAHPSTSTRNISGAHDRCSPSLSLDGGGSGGGGGVGRVVGRKGVITASDLGTGPWDPGACPKPKSNRCAWPRSGGA